MSPQGDITRILSDLSAGKEEASEQLLPLVYDELHKLAGRYMRKERRDHTLQPTALIHEVYLRLWGDPDASWEDRAHFMRVAARAMRRVLINHAKGRSAQKRGGGWGRKSTDDITVSLGKIPAELITLGEALGRLSDLDPQMTQIIELRFFAGFTIAETARLLDVSESTVNREWKLAKAWLSQETGQGHDRRS